MRLFDAVTTLFCGAILLLLFAGNPPEAHIGAGLVVAALFLMAWLCGDTSKRRR